MFRTNVEDIKKHESSPQIVKIFSKKEIEKMADFYDRLPLRVFNQKQLPTIHTFKFSSCNNFQD
jgi:hypothetical protein